MIKTLKKYLKQYIAMRKSEHRFLVSRHGVFDLLKVRSIKLKYVYYKGKYYWWLRFNDWLLSDIYAIVLEDTAWRKLEIDNIKAMAEAKIGMLRNIKTNKFYYKDLISSL